MFSSERSLLSCQPFFCFFYVLIFVPFLFSSTPDANVFVGDSGSLKDFLGLDLAEEVNDLNKDATDLMTEMEDFLR